MKTVTVELTADQHQTLKDLTRKNLRSVEMFISRNLSTKPLSIPAKRMEVDRLRSALMALEI